MRISSLCLWSVLLSTLLSIGILKVSEGSNYLEAFSHNLDLHVDEERLKKEGERRIQEEARARQEEKYWREYREREAREKREKEERQRKNDERRQKRMEEERKKREEEKQRIQKMAAQVRNSAKAK